MSAGHIRPRGKAWEIRYPLPPGPDGKRRVETKTIRGSKRDAQRALREALSAVDRGEHVSPSKTTVGEYVAERIAGWQAAGRKGRTVGARTAENYRHLAKQLAGIADLPVQRLDLDAIEAWHITLRKRGLAPRTVRVVHGLLDRALADAVRHRLVPRNVARDQGAPATPDADAVDADADAADAAVDAPNAEQVKTLLAKLTDDLWYVPALTALSTGLRRGEQLALRWANVDLDGAKLHVREALDETKAHGVRVKAPKTKAGRRTISLSPALVEALRDHRRQQLERCLLLGLGRPSGDALVFPGGPEGGHDKPSAFSNRWARKAAKLGMSGITWHSLRHAHASALIVKGVPITTIAHRLGHGRPEVTLRIYAHLYEKDDSAAADAIDQALG